jgi:hypothetical protein
VNLQYQCMTTLNMSRSASLYETGDLSILDEKIGHADWNDCLNLNCFSKTPGESFQLAGDLGGVNAKIAESVMIAGLFCSACEKGNHTRCSSGCRGAGGGSVHPAQMERLQGTPCLPRENLSHNCEKSEWPFERRKETACEREGNSRERCSS